MMRAVRSCILFSLLTLSLSACELDVDLMASENVPQGGTIDLKLKVTNESNCPVGGATAIVIPNIPRNILIDQIPDDLLRRQVSNAVDEFCETGETDIPNGAEAFCQREGGDLVCTIDLGDGVDVPVGTQESLVVGVPSGSTQISCNSDGDRITCRIPQGLLDGAREVVDQGSEQVPFVCVPMGPVFVCVALTLNPGEMQMEDFQVEASVDGVVRHFVVAFPEISGGVCRDGVVPGAPCENDGHCRPLGIGTGVCKPGICSGSTTSSENTRGCDPAIATDCDNGTCSICNSGTGNLLSGVACDVTAVGTAAPTMSMWGYAVTAIAMCVATVFLLMRARRREV